MMPLHSRIRQDIETRIHNGELAAGARLPNETELMQTYACSRMTVHKAMSALSTAGLIERRRKAGSFVAVPRISATVLEIPDLQAQAEARGESYEFRLLSRNIIDGNLELSGVHVRAGLPLCHEYRVIGLKAVPEAEQVDFAAISPGSWLLSHVPWTEGENRISAVAANAQTARLLELPPGAACLKVERTTWRNGGDGDLRAADFRWRAL
ncbi:MAG: UTRA domain-containing protein [Asticcacaulis sp.]